MNFVNENEKRILIYCLENALKSPLDYWTVKLARGNVYYLIEYYTIVLISYSIMIHFEKIMFDLLMTKNYNVYNLRLTITILRQWNRKPIYFQCSQRQISLVLYYMIVWNSI